jgi:hypothetical protein
VIAAKAADALLISCMIVSTEYRQKSRLCAKSEEYDWERPTESDGYRFRREFAGIIGISLIDFACVTLYLVLGRCSGATIRHSGRVAEAVPSSA